MKLFIIDAVNYLFRSYFAIGPMTNEEGQSTNAVFGFIRSVQKILKEFSPTHVVCVFDGPDNKKSRRTIYADYKIHRKRAPDDLLPQFDFAYEYCKWAGVPVLCVDGVEADDTMASIAMWAKEKKAEIYLCSSDKDLMQLVDNQIVQLHAHKDNLIITPEKVEELFGVKPTQMLDYLAIVGDASDNIPGLEGFGPKTASALLQEFGNLDEILKHPEKVKGEKKQEILRSKKEIALMSRELATLDVSVKIPHEPDFYAPKEIDLTHLTQFYHKMRFNSLLKELGNAPPLLNQTKNKRHTDRHHYTLIESEELLDDFLKNISKAKEICIDTETTELRPLTAKLVGIGIGIEPGEAFYIPLNGLIKETIVKQKLSHFFSNSNQSCYGHNIKYDLHILQNIGIELPPICFDTLLASYLLDPQKRRHNLDDLALEHFKRVKIPIDSLIGKGKHTISMMDAPIEQVKEYCCEDVDYTCRLKEKFSEELKEKKLESLFNDIEIPLIRILAKMERKGIFLDAEKLKIQGESIQNKIHHLQQALYKEAGSEINLNSPKQLSHLLYHQLGLKPPGKKNTEFSTGADVLEQMVDDHPIIAKILEYRGLEKLRSTYIEALPESILPETHRIHCTFNQSVAATGRLSCQDPNLQNIPVRSQEGLAIRSCFRPEKKGWSYVGGDYSQIELRLLAHFSQDEELIHAFKTGQDIHAFTASRIFNIPEEMVTPTMRSQAKTVNFGILYGQGPYGLSKQLKISMKEASQFIHTYFERYPKVLAFLEDCKEKVRKKGYSETLTGRKRPIPEIHSQNQALKAAAERLAVNTPLQGTAADLIKIAMIEIDQFITKKKLEGFMILQIHDELIFEVPDHEIKTFQTLIQSKMEGVFDLLVPIVVHPSIGKNWAEC